MDRISLTVAELSRRVALPEATIVEIAELGIVEPQQAGPSWRFDEQVVVVIARAARLHRDLGIDWNGVALVLELLEEVDGLRRENQRLRRRLARFSGG